MNDLNKIPSKTESPKCSEAKKRVINPDNKPQIDKFKEAARELEADDDETRFDGRLKEIAKAPAKKPSKD